MKKLLLTIVMLCSFCLANAQLQLGQPADIEMCSQSDFSTFNLTTQIPAILDGLSPNNYTVTFHATMDWAQNDVEAISNAQSFINTANPQTIYVRVEQNSNPSVYDIAEFSIIVNINPAVYNQDFTVCDNDNNPADGLTMIDLEEITEQIWSGSGYSPNELEIGFYASQSDAASQTAPLFSPYQTTFLGQSIWVRSSFPGSGCFSISLIELQVLNCEGTCQTPDDLMVTNITAIDATFGWNSQGDEMQWELLVLYSGGPFPLPTMNGIVTNVNPMTIVGLECAESYDVYVRAVCAGNISDWSQKITFSTQNCGTSGGQPDNLYACAENGTACFDLTVNSDNVLGNMNPAEFMVTYHLSAADANAGVNPLANPTSYCTTVTMGADEIFIRLENNVTNEFEVFWFTVVAQEIVTGQELLPLVACDDDGDGSVTFNLTLAEEQLDTDNPLQYYETDGDAFAQQNPISDPDQYSIATSFPLMTVYIRETIAGSCDTIHALILNGSSDCNVSNLCIGANSLCNALGLPFANTTGIDAAESGNDYGCLGDTPNPTWFYLPVSGAGTINLLIEQSSTIDFEEMDLDADFIVYGPFTNPQEACTTGLNESNIVNCSYSASFDEIVEISGTQAGEYYLLMVTNYTGEPGYIRISELGSSQGEIDCTGLRLNAFLDANSNGTQDTGEVNFALGQFHYEVNNNGDMHHITSPSGIHRIYDLDVTNSYDLSYSIDPQYQSYYGITTASYSDINVVAGAGLQQYNFPITVTQTYNDVSVNIVSAEAPRPGFTYHNTIVYSNLGNQAVGSGMITFTKDPLVTITGMPAGAVPTANGFTFSYANLQPFETRELSVAMQVPVIPTVNLGDVLTSTAAITPTAGDATPENNNATSAEVVIGSYDPNDKMESRGPEIVYSTFSNADYLYYTIRFENTGTASAINVRISDILEDTLDESTVQMIAASHNYILDRVDNRLTWRFENILLPPTIEDADASKGFVQFRVKPVAGYSIGDVISNTASIFFDFNPAIVTNTFTSTFVTQLAVNEFESQSLVIYPNPATDFVTIAIKDGADSLLQVAVYDIAGKVILSKDISLRSETIDLSAAAPGLYLMEITTAKGKTIKKLLLD